MTDSVARTSTVDSDPSVTSRVSAAAQQPTDDHLTLNVPDVPVDIVVIWETKTRIWYCFPAVADMWDERDTARRPVCCDSTEFSFTYFPSFAARMLDCTQKVYHNDPAGLLQQNK